MPRPVPKAGPSSRKRRCAGGFSAVSRGSEYTAEEVEFLRALERYKVLNHRPIPTWCEVLQVVVALGYRKVAEPKPVKRDRGE